MAGLVLEFFFHMGWTHDVKPVIAASSIWVMEKYRVVKDQVQNLKL